MAVTLVTTPGAVNANSYATVAEAAAYFEARSALDPPWDDADDPAAMLVMATRVLNAFVQALRVYVPGPPAHYVVRRAWTGSPASPTQRLAWPRLGMYTLNGHPIDFGITNSVAAATVVTTDAAHGLQTGQQVFIVDSDSTPSLDGAHTITVLSSTTFSVPVTVTVAGTAGRVTYIPQDLKDAQIELAGQLLATDRTLDNDIQTLGITSVRAGSVALSFKEMISHHVLPEAVWMLMPATWLTDELYEQAISALFDVVSE